jgi:hypothetical protein
MPDELEIVNYNKSENKNYIEKFYNGYLGQLLKEKGGGLAKFCQVPKVV